MILSFVGNVFVVIVNDVLGYRKLKLYEFCDL